MAYGKCFLSGVYGIVERHHIFGGARRDLSERYGLVVELSPEKHRLNPDSAHRSGETADRLHRYGQMKVMIEQRWTVEEFRLVFGRNYLDEDELAVLEAERAGRTFALSVSCADSSPRGGAKGAYPRGGAMRGTSGFQVLAGALPF